MSLTALFTTLKGGAGSGNLGHAGRVGHRGGSAPKGMIMPTGSLVGSMTNPKSLAEVIKIAHLSDYPKHDYLEVFEGPSLVGAYNPKSKELNVSLSFDVSHNDLLDTIGGSEDDVVHPIIKISADKSRAEKVYFVADQGAGDSTEENLKNIYAAMDKMKRIEGLSGLPVTIYMPQGSNDVDTSI